MAAAVLVEIRKPPDDGRLIRCRVCSHVLAIRTPGGQRILILGPAEVDERNRIDVDCPVCRTRRRLPRRIDETSP